MFAHLRVVGLFVALAILSVAPAVAQPSKAARKEGPTVAVSASATVLITNAEVVTIREYYVAAGRKQKPLPQGIAKQIARGKKVPPGIMRTRLPEELVAKLPPREGYEWAIANDVVLLIDVSGIVRDILRDIF